MDLLYQALSQYRRRQYDKCVDTCTAILDKQPLDQAAWCLKIKALTQRVYVDDLESEDSLGTGEESFDENVMATAPRVGTSMVTNRIANTGTMSARPRTATGRPISGVVRGGTAARNDGAVSLRGRSPMTGQSARSIRIGTAAMLSQKEGPFVQVSRLNLPKYATDPCLSKPLFEYIFYHEGDIRSAMEMAVQATQTSEFKDWWWKVQLAKCYMALNLVRDAEQQLRSAVKQQHHVETFIRLIRVYMKLDQPLSALEVCKGALQTFPDDVSVLTEVGRLYETIGDAQTSVKHYRNVVIHDAMNTEAIACIGVYHFYNNQPELALRYYRRVLAMGGHSAELYNNLGLCCLYSQQLDLTLPCFQRALHLATDPLVKAEVWYNLSHVSIAAGDLELAVRCLTLCLSCDGTHASAYVNLAVLQIKLGHVNVAKSHLAAAKRIQPDMDELQKNLELLQNK